LVAGARAGRIRAVLALEGPAHRAVGPVVPRPRWESIMRGASLLLILASLLSPSSARADASPGHCAPVEPIVPLEGDPTRYRVVSARGTSFPRTPPPARATGTPLFVIEARAFTFDADGSDATPVDTLVVEVGSTVRWQWVAGIHTLTNGTDGSDPQAGQFFDYVLTSANPTFDSTFTVPTELDFFCFVHEPSMVGHLSVTASNSVPPSGVATRASFARPPAPNPSGGRVGFAIALPREQDAEITILDLGGRRVAAIHRGRLGPGEHAFRWDGRSADGAQAPAGRYTVLLRADRTLIASRAFTIVR
jgi:plastocyanin